MFWPTYRCRVTAPSAFGSLYAIAELKTVLTARLERSPIVLHYETGNAVLKWFIEFAEAADSVVYQIVDIGVCFLLLVDCIDLDLRVFLANAKQVIYRIIDYFGYFFGNELFLESDE